MERVDPALKREAEAFDQSGTLVGMWVIKNYSRLTKACARYEHISLSDLMLTLLETGLDEAERGVHPALQEE